MCVRQCVVDFVRWYARAPWTPSAEFSTSPTNIKYHSIAFLPFSVEMPCGQFHLEGASERNVVYAVCSHNSQTNTHSVRSQQITMTIYIKRRRRRRAYVMFIAQPIIILNGWQMGEWRTSPTNTMKNCSLTHQANAIITIIYCYLSAAACSSPSCSLIMTETIHPIWSFVVFHALFAITAFLYSRTAEESPCKAHLLYSDYTLHFVSSTINVAADQMAWKSTCNVGNA